MKNYMFYKYVLLTLVCTLVIQGCTADTSLVLSNTCIAPCWFGITPGITQKDDLFRLSKSNLTDNVSKIVEDPDGWNIFDYRLFLTLNSDDKVEIYTIDGIVARTSFINSKGISSISNMIDLFGEPEYVARSTIPGPGSSFLLPSSAYHDWFFVIYPKTGVVFGLDTYYSGKNIQPNTKITDLQYFNIGKFDLLLHKGFLVYSTEEYSEDQFTGWKGYGGIDEIYP
jgi:hypothetical protein